MCPKENKFLDTIYISKQMLLYHVLEMEVFHVGKRRGKFVHWEPIFIGTHLDPHYDERLSWEGKKDKMTQVG